MPEIIAVKAREILDSRGNPTVEADVILDDESLGRAAVLSGASTGELEALELRDGDTSRYHGKGTRRAVQNILNEIGPAVKGRNPEEQEAIDRLLIELDGTPTKERLGANTRCLHGGGACRRPTQAATTVSLSGRRSCELAPRALHEHSEWRSTRK